MRSGGFQHGASRGRLELLPRAGVPLRTLGHLGAPVLLLLRRGELFSLVDRAATDARRTLFLPFIMRL